MQAETSTIQAEIDPCAFAHYRDFLFAVYSERKSRLKSYSYIRFAQDLGLPATGVVNQIVRGHRPLTVDAAERIAKCLKLKAAQRDYLLKLVSYNNAKSPGERQEHLRALLDARLRTTTAQLGKDQLQFFSTWYHAVIRELAALPDFKEDCAWIAEALENRIKPSQAEESLELLVRLGFLQFDPEVGHLRPTMGPLATGSRASGLAIAHYQQAMIDLGKDSISTVTPEERSVSSVTLRLSTEKFEDLTQRIQHLLTAALSEESRPSNSDGIYQMNVQLFPLMKRKRDKEPA